MVIRGDKDEGAVLCTGSKTYDIKEAEISNSMLLVPGLVLGTDLQNEGEQDVKYKQVQKCFILTVANWNFAVKRLSKIKQEYY